MSRRGVVACVAAWWLLAGATLAAVPEGDRWRFNTNAALPPQTSAALVSPVLVVAKASSQDEKDLKLAGQAKRGTAEVLRRSGLRVVTTAVTGFRQEDLATVAARNSCVSVLLARVQDHGGQPPTVTLEVLDAAGATTVHALPLAEAMVQPPPVAIHPVLTQEKLARDHGTLELKKHLLRIEFLVVTYDGRPVERSATVYRRGHMGRPVSLKQLCRVADASDEDAVSLCQQDQTAARVTWSSSETPKTAVALALMTELFNRNAAAILGGDLDLLILSDDYLPVTAAQRAERARQDKAQPAQED